MTAMLTATTIDIHKPAFLVEVPGAVPDSLSWAADISNDASWEFAAAYASVTGVLALGLIAAAWRLHGTEEGHHTAAAAGAGLLFSGGMSVGGMMDRSVILSFLSLTQDWSPRLAFVMGGGVTVSIIAFHYVNVRHAAAASCPYERGAGELASDFTEDERKAMTFLGRAYKVPGNTLINFQLVLGAMLFGLGWGMSGFCPGPALGVMASGAARSWLWLPGFALGVGAWIGWEHWLAVKGDKSAAATKRSTRANSAGSSSGRSSPAAVVPTMPRTVPDFATAPPLDAAGRQKARRMLRHALALLGEDETTATATSTKAQHSKKTPLLSADAVGSESCRAETFQAIQAHGDGTSDLLCAALRVAALAEKAPGASSAGSGRSSAASSVQAGSDCGCSDLPDV